MTSEHASDAGWGSRGGLRRGANGRCRRIQEPHGGDYRGCVIDSRGNTGPHATHGRKAGTTQVGGRAGRSLSGNSPLIWLISQHARGLKSVAALRGLYSLVFATTNEPGAGPFITSQPGSVQARCS